MTKEKHVVSEDEMWSRMIQDLQDSGYTLQQIADHVGVSVRQVSNWKTGDRPLGLKAVRLYTFHMKRPPAPSQQTGSAHSRLSDEARMKANARAYANTYLRRGLIKKEPCEDCGVEEAEMHHDDYSKPLDIRWKCRTCHMTLHRTAAAGK